MASKRRLAAELVVATALLVGSACSSKAPPVQSPATLPGDQAAAQHEPENPDGPVVIGDVSNCYRDAVDLARYACFSSSSPDHPDLAVHRDAVFACVKAADVLPPVTLIAQVELRADGGVSSITVRGDEHVAACLSERAAAWIFAPPQAGNDAPSTTVIRLRTRD